MAIFGINKEELRTFFQSDRAMLMACIGIALFFWLLIKLSKTFNTTFECDIRYNVPEGKTFREYPPSTIIANIRGSGWDLISNFFAGNDPNILLNLSENPQQAFLASQLKTKISNKLASQNIEIVNVNIELLEVQLDEELVKKVPIRFGGTIDFASNYFYRDSLQLQPDSVSITGAVDLLDTLQYWLTEDLDLTNLEEDYQGKVALWQQKGQNIQVHPTEVDLLVPVEQFTEKALFVPISVINAVDSLKVFPESVKLNFRVGLSQFNTVNSDDFVVEVDAQKIANSQSTTAALQLKSSPAALRNIKMSPKSVEFYFLKKKEEAGNNE